MLISFLLNLWYMVLSLASYMFIGFIIAGVMNHFFSLNFITKHIGASNKVSVIKSAMLGVPIPLCSCSVLPVAKTLKILGASNASVLAFLITTPVTGVDSIYLTLSVLGARFAFSRVIIVVIIGVVAGFLSLYLLREQKQDYMPQSEPTCCSMNRKQNNKNFFDFLYYSFYELPKSIANSLVYGILAGAIITMVLPSFPVFQNQYLSIITALLISIPLYVCASGSVPVALALLNSGFSQGAVLAFLVAGPASNFVSVFTIKNILGKNNLKIYLFTIFIITLIASIVFNFLPINFFITNNHFHEHSNTTLIDKIVSILFSLMIFSYFLLNLFNKNIKNRLFSGS